MDILVTEFKHRWLEIIRRVENTGRPVAITRHCRVVARLQPAPAVKVGAALKPSVQRGTDPIELMRFAEIAIT